MDIRSAIIQANAEGKYIYRKSERKFGIRVLPTNTQDCCLLISDESDQVGKRWNPNANDLIATDWEIN